MAHQTQHTLINTTFPVLLPDIPGLRLEKPNFDAYIKSLVASSLDISIRTKQVSTPNGSAVDTVAAGTVNPESGASDDKHVDGPTATQGEGESAFMKGLLSDKATVPSFDDRDGKMLTENSDVAYRTSGQAIVDCFYEMEEVVSGGRLRDVLEKAWQEDAAATLKIIWNARSIHLGKSSRNTFYRAVGWLAETHPLTLIINLPWLVRPLIPKKTPKRNEHEQNDGEIVTAKDADSDVEFVDGNLEDEPEGQPKMKKLKLEVDAEFAEFHVKYGVAHGYWKDLLNILALAANDQLKVNGDPRSVLNVEKPAEKKYKRDWTEGQKKTQTAERHARALKKLEEGGFYKALHLSVARLFADQLQTDLTRLKSGQKDELKRITLAAKWAPSHKGMHDQHTFIVSSIAELLHPFESVCPVGVDAGDRELYLKHARSAYQTQTLSPLRKHLQIVERPITAGNFDDIKYERVPSLAMKQYTPLFAKKDLDHFDKYIEDVASGKSKISGATLLPSTMVAAVSPTASYGQSTDSAKGKRVDAMVENKLRDMQVKVLDSQWNTLVQRIKDSGKLQSAIAVCDVSGSMSSPRFPDGTCPMDSSIGLSLLLAEVTQPPFGGAFITFSEQPSVMNVGGKDDARSLAEKVDYIKSSNWSMNTDFVAVFEKLILPMAVNNKLSQEDMVKQVFVFSDMQFDSAARGSEDRWTTSYERIQKKFADAGYEMPHLIFWNLAGGRAGYDNIYFDDEAYGDDTAPKPVTAAEEGTSLVSGYSQGQMKMFLDNGNVGDPGDEEMEMVEEEGEDGEVVVKKQEKSKQDPLATVRKAISHDAYRMLKVVD